MAAAGTGTIDVAAAGALVAKSLRLLGLRKAVRDVRGEGMYAGESGRMAFLIDEALDAGSRGKLCFCLRFLPSALGSRLWGG